MIWLDDERIRQRIEGKMIEFLLCPDDDIRLGERNPMPREKILRLQFAIRERERFSEIFFMNVEEVAGVHPEHSMRKPSHEKIL